jgi:cysteine desulfurase
MQNDAEHLAKLADYFWKNLKNLSSTVHLNGHLKDRLPSVLNISFVGYDAVALATRLDLAGIAVSTGAACASGSVEPSRVLEAMGLPRERSTSALRISFGRPTTVAEIDQALAVFKKILTSPKVAEPLAAVA